MKCKCDNKLYYRGKINNIQEYWCDSKNCNNLYTVDMDGHIVLYGQIIKK